MQSSIDTLKQTETGIFLNWNMLCSLNTWDLPQPFTIYIDDLWIRPGQGTIKLCNFNFLLIVCRRNGENICKLYFIFLVKVWSTWLWIMGRRSQLCWTGLRALRSGDVVFLLQKYTFNLHSASWYWWLRAAGLNWNFELFVAYVPLKFFCDY